VNRNYIGSKIIGEGLTWLCLLLVVVCSVGAATAAEIDERRQVQLVRAGHMAAQGDCAEAIALLETANAHDLNSEITIGKCAIKIADYEKAAEALGRAHELDPNSAHANLYRGIALYHLGDYRGARTALERAQIAGEEAALKEFYSGLLLLREGEHRQSALAFERAATTGPELVEPVASYYAALAWQSLDENEPLKAAVARVGENDAQGIWGQEAENLMELQAERLRGSQRGLHRWIIAEGGIEYDSNVILRGAGVPRPSDISDDGDFRGVWTLGVGSELFTAGRFTGGVALAYMGAAHVDLKDFDQHFLQVTGWLDYEFSAIILGRIITDFAGGWLDGDSYLWNFDVAGEVEVRWGRPGTSQFDLRVRRDDFLYDDALSADFSIYDSLLNQDGTDLSVGLEHDYPLSRIEAAIYGGYHFNHFGAKGSQWDHVGHRVEVGARILLGWQVELDSSFSYTRRRFDNPSIYDLNGVNRLPDLKDRRDNALQVDVELARDIGRWFEVSLRYQYLDNGSNSDTFNYKRHIGGAYIEIEIP
jgi:hypothetical protein